MRVRRHRARRAYRTGLAGPASEATVVSNSALGSGGVPPAQGETFGTTANQQPFNSDTSGGDDWAGADYAALISASGKAAGDILHGTAEIYQVSKGETPPSTAVTPYVPANGGAAYVPGAVAAKKDIPWVWIAMGALGIGAVAFMATKRGGRSA